MTNVEWLKHIEQAYVLPIRDDIRVNKWKVVEFTEKEIKFLLLKYSADLLILNQEHISDVNQICIRYFFKKAI